MTNEKLPPEDEEIKDQADIDELWAYAEPTLDGPLWLKAAPFVCALVFIAGLIYFMGG